MVYSANFQQFCNDNDEDLVGMYNQLYTVNKTCGFIKFCYFVYTYSN